MSVKWPEVDIRWHSWWVLHATNQARIHEHRPRVARLGHNKKTASFKTVRSEGALTDGTTARVLTDWVRSLLSTVGVCAPDRRQSPARKQTTGREGCIPFIDRSKLANLFLEMILSGCWAVSSRVPIIVKSRHLQTIPPTSMGQGVKLSRVSDWSSPWTDCRRLISTGYSREATHTVLMGSRWDHPA